MKKLVIALFALSLGLFSTSAWAIAKEAQNAPDFYDIYEDGTSTKQDIDKALKDLAKSDWKRITRSQPEVFEMTIEGKTRECYYEGKNIICE
nr:MAG TPA: putative periplasmic protein [Caudoviricetes sp.]